MENKKNTEELLAAVYRNVTTGSENLGNTIPMIKDRFLMRNVTDQMERYSTFTKQAGGLLMRRAMKPEKRSAVQKMMGRSGMMLNTLFDTSDGHLANIIVKGTERGADELEKTLCRLEEGGADSEVVTLARTVVEFERMEAEKMRDFT